MDDATSPNLSASQVDDGKPQALVYVGDTESEAVIRQALSDVGASGVLFKSGGVATAVADRSERASPRLMIVDVSKARDAVAEVAALIGLCDPATAVVVIGASNDIGLYRALKDVGASEYFFKPLVTALLAHTCTNILSNEEPARPGDTKTRKGRLVLVLGARGGVGATTIAVRTAWRLSTNPPRSVALVDLDLQFGDAALQLDAAPNHALREALARADRVDDLFLQRGIINVTKRLDLLASLEPLQETISFEESGFLSLLETLQQRYRYVVVDLPPLRAVGLPNVLRLPSLVMLVSDGGLASAREMARLRDLLGPTTADRTILHVLNKNGGPGALPLAEFTRGAGRAPDVLVPWSREIATAANLGVKIKPECPILDHALAPVFTRLSGEKAPPRRSLLARLLG